MATKPRKGGGELFYLDEHGNTQDAALHEEILRDGDHAAALAISEKVAARILKSRRKPDKYQRLLQGALMATPPYVSRASSRSAAFTNFRAATFMRGANALSRAS
jgi:hypothetical protein